MGTSWRRLLAPVDKPTGDKRRMAPGAMRSRELPLPLKWQRSDEGGHDTSVVVGKIDALEFTDEGVWGSGEFFDDADPAKMPRMAEDANEAMHLLSSGVVGPSVDAGAATATEVVAGTDKPPTEEQYASMMSGADGAPELELRFTDYEIAGATLVPIPAFAESGQFDIMPDDEDDDDECDDGYHLEDGKCVPDEDEEYSVTAAVTGSTDLPVADRDMAWNGPAAASRVFDKYTDADGNLDVGAVSKAFLYRDADSDPQNRGSYKLGFADIVDGTLSIVPRGVAATAGGRGVESAKVGDDQSGIESKICSLYGKVRAKFDDWPECPFAANNSADTMALVAAWSAPSEVFDAALFLDPELPALTAFTYEPDTGKVYGHLAPNGACHVGYKDSCVAPPESGTGYSLFHRYAVDTTGGLIDAGRLTLGHGKVGSGCSHDGCGRLDDHACGGFTLNEAVEHHDGMKTIAHVRVGTDDFGIWFAGVAAQGLTPDDVKVMSRQKLSGDWRLYGAGMELTEILALSSEEPGFPVATATSRGGRQFSLVAASPVSPIINRPPVVDVDELVDVVAARVMKRMDARAVGETVWKRLADMRESTRVTRGEIAARKIKSLSKGAK